MPTPQEALDTRAQVLLDRDIERAKEFIAEALAQFGGAAGEDLTDTSLWPPAWLIVLGEFAKGDPGAEVYPAAMLNAKKQLIVSRFLDWVAAQN